MKQFLEIGKIVAPQALRGEVRVQPWCDGPEFITGFKNLYFDNGQVKLEIEKSRVHKNMAVIKINGYNNADEANSLRGKVLYINRDDVKLAEGVFFIQDLIGIDVVDADDETICYGKLTDVTSTGANDVYHITKDEKTVLIPAIPQVVIDTDVEKRMMRIKPLKGLFEDEV